MVLFIHDNLHTDSLSNKLHSSHVFRVSTNVVDNVTALYHTVKLTNGVWVLCEIKVVPGQFQLMMSLKSRVVDACGLAAQGIMAIVNA